MLVFLVPGLQPVHEEGVYGFEDVCLSSVVLPKFAACLGVFDSLEKAPEDGGADRSPVERARL